MKLRFNRLRFWAQSDCPARSDWNAVICGLVPEEIAKDNLKHAASCVPCGKQLRDAFRLLKEETTAEEEQAILELISNRPGWRREMADEMARRSQSALSPMGIESRTSWKLNLSIGGVLVLAFVALVIGIRVRREMSPAVLIAEAYSEHRTVELRFRGAKSSPERTERGGIPSNLDKPASLLHAEAKIADELSRNPNAPILLDCKAQADLLDGNFETAIESLERAIEVDSKADYLKTDLATAYFMRAEATKRAIDYGRAVDLLGQVLAHNPGDAIARFNRAIAEERLLLFEQAISDWEQFLKTEKDGGWLAEGRQRLDSVKARRENHTQRFRDSPVDPSAAIHALSQFSRSGQANRTAPPENYLDTALVKWLPLIAEPNRPANDEVWEATFALAKILEDQHRDEWLRDLIRAPYSPAWRRGMSELARAAEARSAGDAPSMATHAKDAIVEFRAAHNLAGSAAASFEYTKGLNQLGLGDLCRAAARDGLRDLTNKHYPWIEANLWFEFSTCAGSEGDVSGAESHAKRAESIADRSDYESLRLEAKFYLDGVSAPWIAAPDAWDRMRNGLEEFWEGQSAPVYGANFYGDMTFAAEAEKLWYLAETTAKESVVWCSKSEDRTAEAAAHHHLAEAAEAASDPEIAEREFERAEYLLEHCLDVNRAAIVTLNVERASLEVRQNQLKTAAALLNRARTDVQDSKTEYVSLPFHEALGELYLRTNELKLAEESLSQAIDLIESPSNSRQSDRDQIDWHEDNARPYRDLVELYARVEHDADKSFALQERLRGAPFEAFRARRSLQSSALVDSGRLYAGSPANLVSWVPKLPQGTAILSSMTFASGTAIWLANSDGVALNWLNVPEEQVRSTLEQFARLCSDPTSDMELVRRDGRTLYAWFVEPFSSRLVPNSTIVFEPDESVGPVPFPALVMPNGQYLSERFTIAESLGTSIGNLDNSNRFSPRENILAIGDPQALEFENAPLPPLPAADQEASNVSSKFNHRNLLLGRDATLVHVRELLPSSSVFHFAGHAISTNSYPALVLSGELPGGVSLLDAPQLSALNLKHLRLAVLSGCDTADADQGIHDANNLVRIFIRTGVPDVVASDWRVNSQTTSELMNVFYSQLLQGKAVPVALGEAERSIRQEPARSHPYYWAGFGSFRS